MTPREKIEHEIQVEVLQSVTNANEPLTPTAIHKLCPTAADLEDTRRALKALVELGQIQSFLGSGQVTYGAPGLVSDYQSAVEVRHRQPVTKRRPSDVVASILSAQGRWMTVAEIEREAEGMEAVQIRNALANRRFKDRPTDRCNSTAKEYGLADWPATDAERATAVPNADGTQPPEYDIADLQPDAVVASPRSRIERVVQALESANRWMLASEIADALGEPLSQLRMTLKNGVYNGHLTSGYSEKPRYKRYGLATWTAERSENEQSTAPRFGLFSDGTLSIQTDDGDVDLPPDATRALVAYLIGCRGQIADLFDEQVGGAS